MLDRMTRRWCYNETSEPKHLNSENINYSGFGQWIKTNISLVCLRRRETRALEEGIAFICPSFQKLYMYLWFVFIIAKCFFHGWQVSSLVERLLLLSPHQILALKFSTKRPTCFGALSYLDPTQFISPSHAELLAGSGGVHALPPGPHFGRRRRGANVSHSAEPGHSGNSGPVTASPPPLTNDPWRIAGTAAAQRTPETTRGHGTGMGQPTVPARVYFT